MSARRTRWLAHALCLFTAFLVWNGIFGLLVSRGEKQYLLDQARYELRLGPEASLPARMRDTIRDGAKEATRWAVVVFVLASAAVWVGGRAGSRDEAGEGSSGGVLDD
ncbi:hypothetical protein [Luteitalea sp.]|uniref:hypothetical protein n=1 Tax=Luteitalea sp. TaxID=2004800 RepID=UPI0025BA85F2|nr:hypothetical protein [Luteitalea sp.]